MPQKLTREQALIITGYTGILCCDFHSFHGNAEERLGRPIFTHEFPSIKDELQEAYRADFMALLPEKE